MPHTVEYPPSPLSLDDNSTQPGPNLFSGHPINTTFSGNMIFYIRRNASGVRRGPIYPKNPPTATPAQLYSTDISFFLHASKEESLLMKVEIRIVDEGGGFVIGLVQQHGERPRHYVVEDAAGNLGVAKKAGGSRGTQFVMGGKDGGLWVPTTVDGREWYDNHDGGWNTLGLGDALRVAYVSEVDEENIRDRRRDRFWDPAHNILM